MPQVSDRFGPFPVPVVLDGAGAGQVSFQAVGNNLRITNLFAKVTTSVSQALVTIYKGNVGDIFTLDNSNSGSTGAKASGNIDLLDGETVIVRWTGGDAGAIATATFTGITVPFDRITNSEFAFDDDFAAADGTIIYPALQSPNYVPLTTGWRIGRDGSVDFANGNFRGTVFVQGSNGSYVKIYANGAEAEIELQPPMSGTATFTPGFIRATSASDVPLVEIVGAAPLTPVAGGAGQLNLGADPALNQTAAQLLAQEVVIGDASAGSTMQVLSNIQWGSSGTVATTVEGKDSSVTTGTTTSATFTNNLTTSGIRGVVFFASPSGEVVVSVSSGGFHATIGAFTLTDFEVRDGNTIGSGSIIRASDENTCSQFASATPNQPGQHKVSGLVSGLTPGSQYNASLTYRTTSNTGSWNRRKILVTPAI